MALNAKLLSKVKGKMPAAAAKGADADEQDPMFDIPDDDSDAGDGDVDNSSPDGSPDSDADADGEAGNAEDFEDAGDDASEEDDKAAASALKRVPTEALEAELKKRKHAAKSARGIDPESDDSDAGTHGDDY